MFTFVYLFELEYLLLFDSLVIFPTPQLGNEEREMMLVTLLCAMQDDYNTTERAAQKHPPGSEITSRKSLEGRSARLTNTHPHHVNKCCERGVDG